MSAANFATVVILARALTPSAFGAFVLAYAALLFVNGIQTGLVTQPHNVLGQGKTGDAYRRYTLSTAAGQAVFSGIAAAIALVAALAVLAAGGSAAGLLFALVPALVAWQLQEFTRRVLYTETRMRTAFAIDVVGYGGQVALILALVAADRASGPAALYAVALSSGVAAVLGGWAIRRSLRGRVERVFLRENWSFGKWLGAAIAASWLSTQLFFYLTAVVLNAAATAGLKAAQTVLGPLNAFLLFITTVLPIRLAAARELNGEDGLRTTLRLAYLVTLPFVLVYGALVAIFAGPILEGLYGAPYGGYVDAVRLFTVYYVVIHAAYVLSGALSARRLTRPLFTGNLWAAAVGVVAGLPLVRAWGVNGAVVGMILTALVMLGVFWHAYRRSVPRPHPAAVPLADPFVYVVVLNLNRSRLPDTEACLASLAALAYPRYRIVVVDNGSTDDSPEIVRREFPDVEVLETGVNLGFGGGSNVGIRHALEQGADAVWLFNNDAVAQPGALTALVETAAANPQAGIVGSAVYRFDSPAELEAWGGGTYSTLLGITTSATRPVAASELAFITGASMFLTRAFVEDAGLFDESYFMYMEDADLCHRARQHGWELAVAGSSVVFHKGGWTINDGTSDRSNASDRFQAQGGGIFIGKHAGPAIVVSAPMRLSGMVVRRVGRRQLRSIPGVVRSFVSGVGTGLRGGGEPPVPNGSPGLEP